MDVFEILCHLRGVNGDGPEDDDKSYSAAEPNAFIRTHPEWGKEHREFVEFIWREVNHEATEAWLKFLVDCARYLSDLIGGDVPILASREVVESSLGISRPTDAEAIAMGKTMQRAIDNRVRQESSVVNEKLLADLESLLTGHAGNVVPADSRWLTTKDIAARLGISKVGAERKCRSGEIDADKTTGGQWRTTEKRLNNSPYLKRRNGRRKNDA